MHRTVIGTYYLIYNEEGLHTMLRKDNFDTYLRDTLSRDFQSLDDMYVVTMYMYHSFSYVELGECKHDTCPICYDEFRQDSPVIVLECKHVYHFSCINEWFDVRHDCPMCRQ